MFVYTIIGEKCDKLIVDVEGQDSVDLVMSAQNKNAQDLLENAKLKSGQQVFSIWYLFEINIMYKLYDNKEGYSYTVNLTLKQEYRYLDLSAYTDKEWRFEVQVSAKSNTELKKVVDVWFTPQQLTSFRLENYSTLISRVGSDNNTIVSEFESSESESSLIIPGESGLIKGTA